MHRYPTLALIIFLTLSACERADPPPGEASVVPAAQAAFWDHLATHCGNAYAGELAVRRPFDDIVSGEEQLIVHFRECDDDELRLPFHIERPETGTWDRSRTWVFMRADDGLELRHDHRHEDGTPEDDTWYGGHTESVGTANEQRFIFTDRLAPDGRPWGWRIQIYPRERYTYGTFRGDEWTWRVDFDLSHPVPAPPAPWGHEQAPGTPSMQDVSAGERPAGTG